MIRWESTAQVWGISGNLGGGKSLSAVAMIVDALKRGWFIVTNMDLRIDLLSNECGYDTRSVIMRVDMDDSDPLSWPSGSPRGSGGNKRVVVVLDEVAEWFDQYSGTSPAVRNFLSWLRHSSKRSQDVILIVQRKEYLAKSLRILVSRWVWCEDLAVWRIPVLRIRIPFCRGLVMRNVSDRIGNILQYLDCISKAEYGRFYNTAQCLVSKPGESVEYSSPFKYRPPALPGSVFLCLIVLLVSTVYLLYVAGGSLVLSSGM